MQGFIKDWRKEIESDIWMMPPLYHRVWQWLKYNVNHYDQKVPMKDGSSFTVKKGQRLTSVRGISKGVSWYEGYTLKEPNPKTISTILAWLEKQGMISIERGRGNRQYTLITLMQWDKYQSNDKEGNSKVTVDGELRKQCADINKNEKNEKKKREELRSRYSLPQLEKIDKYFEVIKRTRKSGKISDSIPLKEMEYWERFDIEVVIHSIDLHIRKYPEKREEYTRGIMRGMAKEGIPQRKARTSRWITVGG